MDVYIFIYTSIYNLLNYTRPSFSVKRVSGRVNQDVYILTALFSNGSIPTAIFPTAIFSTAIFLVYINHPDHLSSSISTCDFSLLDFSIVSHATQWTHPLGTWVLRHLHLATINSYLQHSPSARRKRGRTLDTMAVPSMDVSQSIEEEMPDFLFCGTTTSKKFLAFPNICFDEGS